MSYEDEVSKLKHTIMPSGNSAAISVIGVMEVLVFAKRADNEIAELKRENKQLHTLLGTNKPFFKES